jgi:hypothetical protein
VSQLTFFDAARPGKNALWRYLVGLGVIVIAFFVSTAAISLVVIIASGVTDLAQFSQNAFLIVAALPFAGGLIGLWLSVRLFHERPFRSLITPQTRPNWRRFWRSAMLWFVLSALGDLLLGLLVTRGNYAWQWNARAFWPFALLTLLLIPIQAATEELVMRGYLMQAIGLRTRAPWLPLLFSAVAFALLHGLNPEVGAYGWPIMFLSYLSMGLLLGWVAWHYAGLEAAMGLHIANNIYASLMVTFPDSAIPSPALFVMRSFDPLLSLIVLWAMAALYLLGFAWLERRASRNLSAPGA